MTKSLKVLKSKITLRPILRPRKRSKQARLRGIKYISLKVLIKNITSYREFVFKAKILKCKLLYMYVAEIC